MIFLSVVIGLYAFVALIGWRLIPARGGSATAGDPLLAQIEEVHFFERLKNLGCVQRHRFPGPAVRTARSCR